MNPIRRVAAFLKSLLAGGVAEPRAESLPEVDFAALEKAIRYTIKDRQIFSQAMSHRSYLQVPGGGMSTSYERLEFLGDAILSLVVAEYLFQEHANAEEGVLTKIRSRLVNRKSLSVYSQQTRLDKFILMSSNASRLGPRGMDKILADAFEAVIAAVYLDGGLEAARTLIMREMKAALASGAVKVEDENFKSQLLEAAQGSGLGVPRYLTLKEEGPDHDRTFTIEVYLDNTPYGVGMGKNKKDAEQAAAEEALGKIQNGL